MNEVHLTLTEEERDFLVGLLERALKEVRVEEHRTRTPSYREVVMQDDVKLTTILGKLAPAPV